MKKRAAQVLVGAAMLSAAGLLLAYALGLWPFRVDDDDRPPIIVNNGSLILKAAPHDDGPGEWQAQGKRRFRHEHPHDGPKVFRVSVRTGGYQQCENLPNDGVVNRVEEIEMEFVDNTGGEGAVSMGILSRPSGKYLNVFVSGVSAQINPSDRSQLTIDVARMTAATFYFRNQNRDPVTCTFTPTADEKFRVEQRR
jgi:hypothetical protein